MKIHHLDCGTMCPACRRLMNGDGGWLEPARMVCHCLLVETGDGWLLVDTGIGLADLRRPGRLGPIFGLAARPTWDESRTAVRQVEALGLKTTDVRHIVVTHLDLDHAGGIADFPQATVHVHAAEWEAASPRRRSGRRASRYIDAQIDAVRGRAGDGLITYGGDATSWRGMEARPLRIGRELDDVLLISLHGHSAGHCGVAVNTGAGWRVNCGDAYMHRATVRSGAGPVPAGVRAFQRLVAEDYPRFVETQAALRRLLGGHADIALVSAHDPLEFEEMLPHEGPP